MTPHLYLRSHTLIWDTLAWNLHQEDFPWGIRFAGLLSYMLLNFLIVSLPHWYTPPRAEAFSTRVHYSWPFSLVLPFTHLYRTHLPEITIRKTFDTGSNCTRPKAKTIGSDTTCWENPRAKPWGDLTRMRIEPTYKGITPPPTQNLKAIGLRVFFLIYCSTFLFLPNVRLRLTLEYLTNPYY